MTHGTHTALGSRPAWIWSGGATVLRHVGAIARWWTARARSRQSLRELDDRLLRDVGITRLQADHEANKAFWR